MRNTNTWICQVGCEFFHSCVYVYLNLHNTLHESWRYWLERPEPLISNTWKMNRSHFLKWLEIVELIIQFLAQAFASILHMLVPLSFNKWKWMSNSSLLNAIEKCINCLSFLTIKATAGCNVAGFNNSQKNVSWTGLDFIIIIQRRQINDEAWSLSRTRKKFFLSMQCFPPYLRQRPEGVVLTIVRCSDKVRSGGMLDSPWYLA